MPSRKSKRSRNQTSTEEEATTGLCCQNVNCYTLHNGIQFCSQIGLVNMEGSDYASKSYWDQRYAEGKIEHEWYYSYELLEPIVQDCRKWESSDRVLEVGCGDKPLIQGFLGLGLAPENLAGIDYAKSVIDLLKAQQEADKYPKLIQLEDMDGCNMRYDDESFDFICEKGTMDAILSDKQPRRGVRNSVKLISEIIRVMKANGTFLLVSHIEVDSDEFDVLMNEILMPSLASKEGVHWKIEAHVVNSGNEEDEDEQPRKRSKRAAEDIENKYGTVYLIQSIPRKMTRHSSGSGEVSFEIKTYDE